MRLSRFLLTAAFAVSLLCALAPWASASEDTAAVTVVHGVPGLTVDVYVNGALTLENFEPGTITDALPLPAGDYSVVIVAAGGDPANPAIEGAASVKAGDRVSMVAHLAADGTPSLAAFADDLDRGARGQGRLIVRHVAAAPPVDAALARTLWRWRHPAGTLENLVSGTQAQVDAWAGRYEASLLPAGTDTVAFGPAPVRIKQDRATIVYAIGDLAGGSFQLLVETRELRDQTAAVTVVHGVPGLVVDVYVDGALALENFQPRTITDVIPLPCGPHDLAIVAAGAPPTAPLLSASVNLAAGSDSTVVAHLAADGSPRLSVFANDLTRKRWYSRVVVRHTAAAPAVDVLLERTWRWWRFTAAALENIENGQEAAGNVRAGRYLASVYGAGALGAPVLGPARLKLRARQATFVYAIGSLADGTLELLTQTRPLR
ncbi:MAG: DUF4397 domain-containing protein [Planctomycetota bacterium]|nr:DUF4397 domain-containing protein [Planctomycetota bacterium]